MHLVISHLCKNKNARKSVKVTVMNEFCDSSSVKKYMLKRI